VWEAEEVREVMSRKTAGALFRKGDEVEGRLFSSRLFPAEFPFALLLFPARHHAMAFLHDRECVRAAVNSHAAYFVHRGTSNAGLLPFLHVACHLAPLVNKLMRCSRFSSFTILLAESVLVRASFTARWP